MALQGPQAVQRLQSSSATAESRPSRIGPINLGMKQAGERSAGNPHAAFDVAGTGNVAWSRCCDTSQPKGRGNREHKLRPKPARQSPTLLIGGIEETSASFAARSAPRSYPTMFFPPQRFDTDAMGRAAMTSSRSAEEFASFEDFRLPFLRGSTALCVFARLGARLRRTFARG